ncbi:MAG: helix-turn-helix domain-containing protein [Bacteriovoracaceae bacterium]|jgi:HTH-type transcriptional regulator/antitoxin HipB|nr:helix-turn-helix domain-containing protein [Bacteriovoracaceae bacterium]
MKKELVIKNIKNAKDFGVCLKRMRKASSLSQKELADLMGMRQPTISDVESGKGTLSSVFKIIQALELNLSISNTSMSTFSKKESKISKMLSQIED